MSGGKASGNQAVQYTLVDDMPGVEGPVYETFRNFAAEGMQVPQQGIFTMPQQQLHSMAQGPSAVSAGGDSDYWRLRPVLKKRRGHASKFKSGCGGSRERKGFMLKMWWVGQEQQEYELVEQLPGYRMTCFRQLSDEI
jgi:hypothetical protein